MSGHEVLMSFAVTGDSCKVSSNMTATPGTGISLGAVLRSSLLNMSALQWCLPGLYNVVVIST